MTELEVEWLMEDELRREWPTGADGGTNDDKSE